MKLQSYDIAQFALDLERANVDDKIIDAIIKFEKAKSELAIDENKIKLELELLKKEIHNVEIRMLAINRSTSGWKNITILILTIIILLSIFNYYILNNYTDIVNQGGSCPCLVQ